MTPSDHTQTDQTQTEQCTGFLEHLDLWLENELDQATSLGMQAHHDRCPQCRQETVLAREISDITRTLPLQACPELTMPDAGKAAANTAGLSGRHFLSQLSGLWRQPLVYVPAFALMLAVIVAIQAFGPATTNDPDVIIVNGQEYTREEIIEAAEELELALQLLDKYGSYPARVVRTELRESHLPLPPPSEDIDPAI